jgi:hypothetical protein
VSLGDLPSNHDVQRDAIPASVARADAVVYGPEYAPQSFLLRTLYAGIIRIQQQWRLDLHRKSTTRH